MNDELMNNELMNNESIHDELTGEGTNEFRLPCAGLHSRKEFHTALAACMAFPEYYGHNLDALHDQLTEIGTDTRLILCGADAMAENLGTYYKSICRVLSDAAEENPHFSWAAE